MTTESKPLTDAELDEIEKRAGNARPGPWEIIPAAYRPTKGGKLVFGPEAACVAAFAEGGEPHWPDVEFMAAARSDVPRLVASLREAKARIAALEAEIDDAHHAALERGERD